VDKKAKREDWSMHTIMWYAVLVWFSASLLSQSLYLAFYREPYDAMVLLKTLGPIYYFVFLIEIVMWVTFFILGFSKMKSFKSRSAPEFVNSTTV
jgi:hypothetical protein